MPEFQHEIQTRPQHGVVSDSMGSTGKCSDYTRALDLNPCTTRLPDGKQLIMISASTGTSRIQFPLLTTPCGNARTYQRKVKRNYNCPSSELTNSSLPAMRGRAANAAEYALLSFGERNCRILRCWVLHRETSTRLQTGPNPGWIPRYAKAHHKNEYNPFPRKFPAV